MRKVFCLLLAASMLMLSACGTVTPPNQQTPAEMEQTPADATVTTAEPVPEVPAHSELYIPDVKTEDVIVWFQEVALDAEYVDSGDATRVQKWGDEITYALLGAPTDADREVVFQMVNTLNSITGFPGMKEITDTAAAELKIHFVAEPEMLNLLGDNFYGCDGGVQFWYDSDNKIYDGTICIRTDLDQYVRNSVIMEEIYNGLGPVQDTDLRSDSLIYSGYSTPQGMTQVDMLIMKLLYNSKIRCGMSAAECEKVIRELYY